MLQGKRIFYIEDDAKNRDVVQMLMESVGAKVNFENWGLVDLAMGKIRGFRPDIILLDLMFRGKTNGYDIYETLQKDRVLSSIPVVIVSASDPMLEIPKAQERHLNGFISKPINLRLFPQQVAAVLDGEQVWYSGDGIN